MILIKTKEEIDIMRQGGKILAGIFNKIKSEVKPGVGTGHLEDFAERLIAEAGGKPAFKGYESGRMGELYPTVLCTSINNEIVHAPSLPSRTLKNGDIIGIDVGMEYKGYFSDMAGTFPVGKISSNAKKLIRITREALDAAIKQAKPGNTLNDIARAIQALVESAGFSAVRELVGHGIGSSLHEEPQITNFVVESGFDVMLKPGMVIAIEPMVNAGSWKIRQSGDPFTIITADGSLSAHFEHTVAITKEGNEILTLGY